MAQRGKPRKTRPASSRVPSILLPTDQNEVVLEHAGRQVKLTNLRKPFWPGITKGDLLQYYADVAPYLLPHLADRAMVMRRYPNGAGGDSFFMKRVPTPHPEWLTLCAIEHSAGYINYPVIQDLFALLWVVNLGCIDLNPWYGRRDDVDRPDYLHFDLDPVPGTDFARVRQAALTIHEVLAGLKMPTFAKTTGSRGIHVYVPIERGPTQKQVWTIAKQISQTLAFHYPKLLTSEYRIARRPAGSVLVDYNQNASGQTLASIYSVRPKPRAPVSMPVTWEEVAAGIEIEDFRLDNARERLRKTGDLWKPLLARRGRARLEQYL
jgi:bifunctional non-homologous end joining protein LigD